MPAKPTQSNKPTPEQKAALEYQRFLETAEKLGADQESPEFRRILRRTVTAKAGKKR
jgi:hypothetical protein